MANITFNLDSNLIEFIKLFAKEKNITQKEVIEMSLEKIRKEKIKSEIKTFFDEMSLDMKKELNFLAESWLEEYNNNLIKIDNDK